MNTRKKRIKNLLFLIDLFNVGKAEENDIGLVLSGGTVDVECLINSERGLGQLSITQAFSHRPYHVKIVVFISETRGEKNQQTETQR